MATILRGYERKTGSFTNKATGELIQYDSYTLHLTSDDREEVTGLFCDYIKCKAGSFKVIGAPDLDHLLDREVILAMDLTASTPTVNAVYAVNP